MDNRAYFETQEELLPYLLAGDFNADGVLDIGGPDNDYYAAGTSLGGIHTSMLMAIEPRLQTGVPVVSGGGMTDILALIGSVGGIATLLDTSVCLQPRWRPPHPPC